MSVIYKRGRSEVCLYFDSSHSVEEIYQFAVDVEGLSRKEFYLTFNGKCLQSDVIIKSPCVVRFHLRLPGGKGGFGSMLRAIGARIEKTTNHEACRDLSGRRMRDVNNEKQIDEWMKKKESEENEREQKRIAKLERILNPKHTYEDRDYTTNIQNNAENINDALKSALLKRDAKLNNKRKCKDERDDGNQKTKKIWMGVDDDVDSDNSESNSPEDIVSLGEETCCSKNIPSNELTSNAIIENVKPSDDDSSTLSDGEGGKKENEVGNNFVENNGRNANMDTGVDPNDAVLKHDSNYPDEIIKSGVDDNAIDINASSMDQPIDLNEYDSPGQLEGVGMDRLKAALMAVGLKCGGTLQERAQRLFTTKNTPREKLDPSLFAKTSKGKGKKK